MSLGTEWNDENRFNQTGYSAATLFPKKKNYKNISFFEEDMKKAERREESHMDFLYELEDEYKMECHDEYCEDYDCDDDYDCDE